MSLLEGIKPDGKADAVALTSGNAQKVSVVETIESTLGTTFTFQTGTATTTSTAFVTGTYAKGFAIENLSATIALYVEQGPATSASWRIGPGQTRFFDLEDPSVLECITASATADYQIGGVS